jgi:PiT family inorganic phosphate transporter
MDAALSSFALITLILIALIFDALNGLHDAANSIATVVSTRVLRPQYAVAWAAFFNFIAFLFFGLHVAQTVGTGIVAANVVDAAVIFGALMGAIAWNLITWWLGIPSSSSHALIGGLAGAAVTKAGLGAIVWNGLNGCRNRSFAFARLFPGVAAGAGGLLGVRSVHSVGGG